MRMAIVLEMCGVAKRYVAGFGDCVASVHVLRSVDLSVSAGEAVAITGSPGTGKSTLLLAAAGLLVPDLGEVRWCGESSRAAAARHASYHFVGTAAGARRPTQRDRPATRIRLIDDPDALGGAGLSRLAHWIRRRCAVGEAIIIGTRNRALARDLAPRVLTLVGGRLNPHLVVAAPRVAEPQRDARIHATGD